MSQQVSGFRSGWLMRGADVQASAEIADTRRSRTRGLLGRNGIAGREGLEGALVITKCRGVHTLGMRFALDIAYLDGEGVVLKIAHVRRNRLPMPVWAARSVVEAEAGAFERWGLAVGDTVEFRE
jgi:uncharacterized membrane protein (UPF0127 family)